LTNLPRDIVPADYSNLIKLIWNRDPMCAIAAGDALILYERHWRHVDRDALRANEAELIAALVESCGKGVMLVD
jgi:hypothetical protein